MDALTNQSASIMEALCWTLLNSVWQAGVLFLIAFIVLRFVPIHLSRTRYAIACGAFAMMVLSSVVTYVFVFESAPHGASDTFTTSADFADSRSIVFSFMNEPLTLEKALQFVETNMSFILLCWSVGALMFSLRMVSGWFFLNGIKRGAVQITDEWYDKLQSLAENIGLTRTIQLAESTRIQVPMVVGFFKPMILIPTSMLSGLSPAQIETIFIHELAHIRRNDYVINLLQIFFESVFFFNPFVWMLSAIIRREREYCCDDEVISHGSETIVYAQALASLEEIRLQQPSLALSLAENKNLLFNRIRRIMEKSAKNSFSRERMVPAVLLVVGLVCASWLTIRTEKNETYIAEAKEVDHSVSVEAITQDTIKKPSRTTYTRVDDNGNTYEETFEVIEGDEPFELALEPMELDAIFDFPAPMSAVDAMSPMMAIDVPGFPDFAPSVYFPADITLDTLPQMYFRSLNDDEFKDFSKAFEEKFKEQFGDFYKKNMKEFDKMMKEMEENFEKRASADDFFRGPFKESVLARQEMIAAEQEALQAQRQSEQALFESRQAEGQSKMAQSALAEVQEAMEARAAEMQQHAADMRVAESNMKAFERSLRKMLIDDGYIKSDEEIKSFKREQNGAMEVNGTKIKKEHLERYNELHRKHFKPGFHHWNVE